MEKKKLVFSLETPYSTPQWPEVPLEKQETILELLHRENMQLTKAAWSSLISPLGEYRRRFIVPSKGKRDKRRKRKMNGGDDEMKTNMPPPPPLSSYVDVGMAGISRVLEKLSAKSKEDESAETPWLSVIFVVGIEPPSSLSSASSSSPLSWHFSQVVTTASLAHPDKPPIRLVGFKRDVADRLSEALGLPRVSCIALREGCPQSEALVEFIRESIFPVDVPWLQDAKTATFKPTKVKATLNESSGPSTDSAKMEMCPPPSALDTSFPDPSHLSRATETWRQGNFSISSRKLPISKAGPISDMESRLGIPVPEMIFGENLVTVSHPSSGWKLDFTAEAALDAVDKTGAGMLQVSYAKEWASSREGCEEADVKRVVRPFDWSYSASYRGTETPAAAEKRPEGAANKLEDSPEGVEIPLGLLRRRDPILFFEEVVLYESELDDNGVSMYSVKLRVHEKRMLLLARLFMRLDGVVIRVRDTRVYVDFEKDEVIREWCAREDKVENLKRNLRMSGLLPDDVNAALRDANQVVELLPMVEKQIEDLSLGS
ncbi:type 2A phosphatase activator TIP41 [Zalerion maritima]|uniref:Type 2A phosphatase activator TIP41 n=1 Tax=Zalerion maritima TaxID=339359 RepID=A0AAD5RMN1_9PEZI|nr:type 2A phosphatase activator TIP41 [Zalerion maritima]